MKFDDEKRVKLEVMISERFKMQEIVEKLGIDRSNIYREIKRGINQKQTGYGECTHIKAKFLGVCNSCERRNFCLSEKHYYDPTISKMNHKKLMKETRAIPKLSKASICLIDRIVSPAIKRGQSLFHIYHANEELQKICCERTIRRLLYNGHLSVNASMLPRYVRYNRTHKRHKTNIKIDENLGYWLKNKSAILSRSFSDYENYVNSHKKDLIVQFDSVTGRKTDKKAILTVTWKKYNFQLGFLIEKNNWNCVTETLLNFFKRFTNEELKKAFGVCICDNGMEFRTFYEIEKVRNSETIHTFYTRPYHTNDKSECERNHEFIRYFSPKRKSLDHLTQDDLDYMFSNINSYIRKGKNNQTPYEMLERRMGKEFMKKLPVYKVDKRLIKLHF